MLCSDKRQYCSLSADFCFCGLRADCPESKMTLIGTFLYIFSDTSVLRDVAWSLQGTLQMLFLKRSYCFAFDKPSFYAWSVHLARGKMGTLKGFGRLEVSFHVQDGFFYESLSVEHHCIKDSSFVLWYFGCEFYCWVECASLFNETIHFMSFISCTVPREKTSSMQRFHSLGLVLLCWILKFVSISAMNIFAKDTVAFVPIATPWLWR